MKYDVQFSKRALRKFTHLPKQAQAELQPVISSLATDPRPSGAKRMVELPGCYRVRQGDYRIVYGIRDKLLVVLVLAVGDRKDIYSQRELTAVRKELKEWS